MIGAVTKIYLSASCLEIETFRNKGIMTKLDLLNSQGDLQEFKYAERKEYLQKIRILKSLYFLRTRTKTKSR